MTPPPDPLANDVYGHTVSLMSDGTLDTYFVGESLAYSFATGTPQAVAYLSMAIQSNLLIAKQATQDYIQAKYSRDQQIQLSMMYLAAQAAGLTNRQAYLGQLLTWLNGIIGALATYVASVQAQTDPAAIASMAVDFSKFPVDPGVTMLGAIQIPS